MESSNLKLIVYGVIGAVAVVGLLGRLMYNDLFGTSTLVLWAPADAEASVSIDGDPPVTIPAGNSTFVEASRGKHKVVSTVKGEVFEVSVKLAQGGPRFAVPTTKNQCFVVADATQLFAHSTVLAQARNSTQIRNSIRARVEKRLVAHQAEKLPSFTVVGEENLPSSVKAGAAIYVLQAFGCDELGVGDAELVSKMRLD